MQLLYRSQNDGAEITKSCMHNVHEFQVAATRLYDSFSIACSNCTQGTLLQLMLFAVAVSADACAAAACVCVSPPAAVLAVVWFGW